MTYEIAVNPDVNDWLTKRALAEKCTVEAFIEVILMAVSINSILNTKTPNNEKTIQQVETQIAYSES